MTSDIYNTGALLEGNVVNGDVTLYDGKLPFFYVGSRCLGQAITETSGDLQDRFLVNPTGETS